MTDQIRTDADALLRPLGAPQMELLRILGEVVMATGSWPVFQYVQARLDDVGLDSDEVFAGLPYFSHGSLTYSLIRRDRTGREEEPVKLTVAGMAHLDGFASTVEMFLRVVNELGDRRAAAPFDPARVVTVEISGTELVTALGLDDEPLVGLLPDLLKGEPAPGTGRHNQPTPAGPASRAASSAGSAAYPTSTTMSAGYGPGSCARAGPSTPAGLAAGRGGRVRLPGRRVGTQVRPQVVAGAQRRAGRPAGSAGIDPGGVRQPAQRARRDVQGPGRRAGNGGRAVRQDAPPAGRGAATRVAARGSSGHRDPVPWRRVPQALGATVNRALDAQTGAKMTTDHAFGNAR